jgi:DHA1 family bicyclomycin/chloramphenicol resistance-like MFS transporter
VSEVQLTLSIFLLGFAVSQLVYGPLSDRFGRRVMVLGGVALYVGASILCAQAPNIETLVVGRFLQALGACSGPVVGRAIVRDIYGPDRATTMLAYMGSAMALAPMAGPIAGGYVTAWFGWHANFALLTGFGVALLAGLALLLKETNRFRDADALRPAVMVRNARALFAHPTYAGYVVTTALLFAGLFAFISGSSFVLIDLLGVPVHAFGLCFAAVVGGYMAGTLTAARLNRRYGGPAMVLAGTALCFLSGAAMLALEMLGRTSVAGIVVFMGLFMVGTGLGLPASQAGAIGPFPRMAGLASALLGTLQMSFAALVGYLVGRLDDGTAFPMALAIALSGALSFLWFRVQVWPLRQRAAAAVVPAVEPDAH